MTQLGFQVADRVIEHQPNLNAAASIMVFVGLHTAYNSVLGVSYLNEKFILKMLTQNSSLPRSTTSCKRCTILRTPS